MVSVEVLEDADDDRRVTWNVSTGTDHRKQIRVKTVDTASQSKRRLIDHEHEHGLTPLIDNLAHRVKGARDAFEELWRASDEVLEKLVCCEGSRNDG